MYVKNDSRLKGVVRRTQETLMMKAQRIAGDNLPDCLKYLAKVMNDDNESTRDRVNAVKHLLDRAIGQPVSLSIMQDLTEGPEQARLRQMKQINELQAQSPVSLTRDQLESIVRNWKDNKTQQIEVVSDV